MRRFAANRVCVVCDKLMLRNGVVDINPATHQVVRYSELNGEVQQTEWIGGLILICKELPNLIKGESFATFLVRLQNKERLSKLIEFHAFHITAFDVKAMEFTANSLILSL